MANTRTWGLLAAIALAAASALSACGSSGSPGHPAAQTSSPTQAVQTSLITCSDISTDLATVVSDEKSEQAQLQEAWVTGGKSADLQSLIRYTSGATGGNQLNDDAATFNSNASAYLSQNNSGLYPGWEQGYDTVWNDINALAADCGQAGAGPVPSSS